MRKANNKIHDKKVSTIIMVSILIISIIAAYGIKRQKEYIQVSENAYNMAFYEVVDYVQNVENYLAKSLISTTPEHGAQILTHVWREADLAQSYLSQLPVQSNELENTERFLNQVSDYSYSLSRKNIYNESLTQEDLDNLKKLHEYSVELENTLNQLSTDINNGRVKWGELTQKSKDVFAKQVSNISADSFNNIENNFHEYAGLIYDGAYSEHIVTAEKRGLTGNDITEDEAENIAKNIVGSQDIKEINRNGLSENTDMETYSFTITKNNENQIYNVSISKKGGHIVYFNTNRQINSNIISEDDAKQKGKEFLDNNGFKDMESTYYTKQDGIITINYAYKSNDIIVYPDLIKVKIALDNGEILGLETTGYLNSHGERKFNDVKITKEQATKVLNKNLTIENERLAVIPTEYKTEKLCWEFKGKIDDRDFLVYINAENGREEDILMIIDSENGVLTM